MSMNCIRFMQGVLRLVSVCLCRYNALLEHRVANLVVKASGIATKHGETRPTADTTYSEQLIEQ
jgi:hypothetical protein